MRNCWAYFVSNGWNKERHLCTISVTVISIVLILTGISNRIENHFTVKNNNLIASTLLVLASLFGEIVIWVKRTKLRYKIRYIEELDAKFELQEIKPIPKNKRTVKL
ncbi:MAG: hypothetical protein GKR88_20815 [Flavobacteriaceae bacterium]|nr:MAG: hypothetical protein GKR88_20815 [Flavobacteriaceae bacterium]